MAKQPAKKTATKAAPKRASASTADKPQLLEVFNSLRKLMKKYEPPMNARADVEGKYDLWSEKEIETLGRKFDAMSFATIIVQSNYVGFYYMPVYCNPALGKQLSPELMKLLKGKACFHVKALDKALEHDIKEALETGFKDYKGRGWV